VGNLLLMDLSPAPSGQQDRQFDLGVIVESFIDTVHTHQYTIFTCIVNKSFLFEKTDEYKQYGAQEK
jgi:hypothetical protein